MIEYPRRVLLATDGSDDSDRSAQVAVALTFKTGAELHLLRVGQTAASAHGVGAGGTDLPGEPPGYAERQARKLLGAQAEEVRRSGGTMAEVHLRMGQPAPAVIALAAELGADLVVIGSGGPSPLRRAVATTTRRPAIGRAAEAIVRTAPCPVLVVRGDEISKDAALGEALSDTKEGDR